MNFTYDGADLGKIIKSFSNNGDNFSLEYLDGSVSSYVCSNNNERQRIINLMIKQAEERQENINLDKLELRKKCDLIITAISSVVASVHINNNKQLLLVLLFLFVFINYEYKITNRKVKELKKYKLFLELLPYLEEVNNPEILKCVEFDKIYQKDLDITTLDEYSYSQVKTIYKTYNEKHKKNI